MQSKNQNSTRLFIFRAVALTITLCYILGPAQLPIRTILHTLSHHLEAPNNVLEHSETNHHNFTSQLTSGVDITNSNFYHEHNVLDFFQVIFEKQSSEEKHHNGESTNIDFKINKHITSTAYNLTFEVLYKVDKSQFFEMSILSIKGYLDQLYRPPKV